MVVLAASARFGTAWAVQDKEEQPLRLELNLIDGSRVIGVPGIDSLPVKTPYAKMNVPLKQILTIKIEKDHETASVDLQNGDKLKGVINLETIRLETVFGKVSVSIEHIRGIRVSLTKGLTQGLVLYYSFDKDEDGKVTDESGRMNHGEVRGAQWVREGERGGAYLFDGSGSHIRVPGSADFNFVDVTILAWVKPDNFAVIDRNNVVSTMTTEYGTGGIQLDSSAGCVRFNYRAPDESTIVKSDPVFGPSENGRWHFMAATYHHDGEESIIALYADGHLCKTVRQRTKQATYSNQRMFIGINCDGRAAGMGHDYGREFKGLIDGIRLYNRALSPGEVEELYDSEK